MNSEQAVLYNFLGELAQAFEDTDQRALAAHILSSAFDYIKASYQTKEGMTPEQLAQDIAKRHKAFKDEIEAFRKELDAQYPTV